MRYQILIFAISLFLSAISAQQKGATPLSTPNSAVLNTSTYAVIVGISDYQDPNIPDLQYADKDAVAFASYLRSPAGGRLDADHLKIILNKNATVAQFAMTLDWLMEVSKENDRVIIYFSGHGDVEKKTITQPGYLLCWDAPARVYLAGGALALPMFQDIITTLSSQNKAKVVVITDACHSGKLAGSSISGSQITGANLAKQYANEIKILSCQPNEFSLEGKQWGGGRGAFSYNLVNALYGMADQNNDLIVALQETERYLQDHVIEEVAPVIQVPMVIGNPKEPLARVDSKLLTEIRLGKTNQIAMLSPIEMRGIEDEVLLGVDTSIRLRYQQYMEALNGKQFLEPAGHCADAYYRELIQVPGLSRLYAFMLRNYAAALMNDAQQAMNDYLKGENIEMFRRLSFDSSYAQYSLYLEKAATLLGKRHYMYKFLKSRAQYFRGLSIRLKGDETKDTVLYKLALTEQLKTLDFDSTAPYVYNEIGYIHKLLKQFNYADKYLKEAIKISPNWIVPRSNLISMNIARGNIALAIECGLEALSIDSFNYMTAYNLALAYELSSNWTLAKFYCKKALEIKKDDKDALLNLSYVYFQEKEIEQSSQLVFHYHELYPEDLYACIPLGCIYIEKGDLDKAYQVLEEAFSKGFKDIALIESETCLNRIIVTEKFVLLKSKYFPK